MPGPYRRADGHWRSSGSPGVASTIPAHLAVLNHPDFINGTHHTKWMEENVDLGGGDPEATPSLPEEESLSRRDITVEVGGRRFAVSYWAPEPLMAASAGDRPPSSS